MSPSLYQSAIYVILFSGLAVLYSTGRVHFASLGAIVLLIVRAGGYGQSAQGAYQGLRMSLPFIEYLTRFHGPLPDGPGKAVLLNICTQCHDLGRVRRTRLSAEGWAEILQTMLNEGAPLTDKDFETVLRYLARNFRPER